MANTNRSNWKTRARRLAGLLVLGGAIAGCAEPEGLMRSRPAAVTVQFDFDNKPLPDIPLPNDIATRYDANSATLKRVNASMLAATEMERNVRGLIDSLDGWGVFQPISIPFTGPLDVQVFLDRHSDTDYNTADDAVYLINVDRDSPEFGKIEHLDIGNGNYPIILEERDNYGINDPHGDSLSLPFEETNEDVNGNGRLDPGEDANHNGLLDAGEDLNNNGVLDPPEDRDADGVLDRPNYLPGHTPRSEDLAGRADALMTFYERETNTLIVQPMMPLQENTTYAVVVTRRVLDLDGRPVGSPFAFVNHTAQTDDLEPLLEVLPDGLRAEEIAFAFTYTTESITADWISVRDGLYGHGVQAHLGDNFPADVTVLSKLRDTAPGELYEGSNPYIFYNETWELPLRVIAVQLLGLGASSEQVEALLDAHKYIDYHTLGTYTSPQLFDRFDENGKALNLDLQSWPNDMQRNQVDARAEEIPFWMTMPRKEVSVRGQGKMAPVVLMGHGYGSSYAGELIGFAGYFAMQGAAVLSTNNVSHGLSLNPGDADTVDSTLGSAGLLGFAQALRFVRGGFVDDDGDGIPDRHAQDLDRDGAVDSGVDFWTGYLFHTRDMMRQSALDYMQLVRVLRTWDGTKQWPYDTNGNGIADDLAGDFDGDGIVDVGSESPLFMMGGSLGGIMATILGAMEPELDAVIPIAGAGRLADVATRSLQPGVPDAVMMRAMGPTYIATVFADGSTLLETQAVELNVLRRVPITTLFPPSATDATGRPGADASIQPGDTMLVYNLDNGEHQCAYLLPDVDDASVAARARVNLESDVGDRLEYRFYRGPVLQTGSTDCELIEDAGEPLRVVNQQDPVIGAADPDDPTSKDPTKWDGVPIVAGELRALAEGLGLRRSNPELRRFMGLAQMVLDPPDPGVLSRFFAQDKLTYPGKGDTTGSRFLIVTTNGDMNVPASGGIVVGRAAGVIDYLNPHPEYGVPANQVLLDNYLAESVNNLNRYTYVDPPESAEARRLLGLDDSLGVSVDVENFSHGQDIWGDNIPRLKNGLNLLMRTDVFGNDLGGYSGAIFPYAIPQGQHGFALPGQMTDWAVGLCKETTTGACALDSIKGQTYDVGWQMFHLFGSFLFKGATEDPSVGDCWTKEACNDIPPTPESRPLTTLP